MHEPPIGRPFAAFAAALPAQPPLREAITRATRAPEPDCVAALLDAARARPAEAPVIAALARRLASQLRDNRGGATLVQGLIQEFALSSQEGVALMCLAEALLRIPDTATRDALIRDKIGDGDWQSHVGQSPSLFVNAATWGLILTGKLVGTHTEGGLRSALARVVAKGGEPLVRRGVDMVMRMMGEQFVAGETIDEALARAVAREAQGFRHSYDMLGEAALTAGDAARYLAAYQRAIAAIGVASARRGIVAGPGISIKLSALHPRYCRAQRERVMDELYPRLLDLSRMARDHDIGLNIDAEEADRLELSLDLLERLCGEPAMAGWNGVGFVIQAYQKRCPMVVDELCALARRTGRRLMVRLVKGAYWDSEIKRAQVDGHVDYPVYTRKVHTDVAYLACARKLLAAPELVYPQFATHNAQTLAAIHTMAGAECAESRYEFQCLHGMGEQLYEQVVAPRSAGGLGRPCRIYAPVGTHETLLAYLVRRLLENGANTSFVNRIADASIPLETLIGDPVADVEAAAQREGVVGAPHPLIRLPPDLYVPVRKNSIGVDLADERRLRSLARTLDSARADLRAAPVIAGVRRTTSAATGVANPADHHDIVGVVHEADARDVADALDIAERALPAWRGVTSAARAAMLERAADAMQANIDRLTGIVVREAGRTLGNAAGEVREAIDFLRYYAAQAREQLGDDAHPALGIVVAISPWNFPLAIFTGQVAAALAAGNVVLAKPAEQTPLIAAEAVALLHAAGVPVEALQFLPGRGETVGAALAADARVRGVVFTGSNAIARGLAQQLAGRLDEHGRPAVLIAETGGQNAMIVDSSALAEQAVADAIVSAFDSAGQRCSALRVLCIQEEVADHVLTMLRGALDELRVGAPTMLCCDVGPMIDDDARNAVSTHIESMQAAGHRVHRSAKADGVERRADATFLAPALIEIGAIGELHREVFGPVLHVLRYRREMLGKLVDDINATGYGLTLGIHSRIDETIDFVVARARAGNIYVNRNVIGAVVGVQPFGGDGLSGTGPKAGGPLYLRRLLAAPVDATCDRAHDALRSTPGADVPALLATLRDWSVRQGFAPDVTREVDALARSADMRAVLTLPGPTGERNTYALRPRKAVLCVAATREDLALQLATVVAAGGTAICPDGPLAIRLRQELPPALKQCMEFGDLSVTAIDAALVAADADEIGRIARVLAQRDGPIVGVQARRPYGETHVGACYDIERLMSEQTVSANTAAAGGNASLMTLA